MEELEKLKQQLRSKRPMMWEDLPDIPLYMDQVVGYLSRQFASLGDREQLTPAMINNYIKDGLLPRTDGKKYNREHLACLLMISAMKQVLSVREMKALSEVGRENLDNERMYNFFHDSLHEAMDSIAACVDPDTDDQDLPGLVVALALRSYAGALACRQILEILCQRKGYGGLLVRRKSRKKKEK